MLRSALVALAFAGACGSHHAVAAAIEVVEAVIPDWPSGESKDQKGSVVVRFGASGLTPFDVVVVESDLPPPFGREATLALEQWLVNVQAPGICGPVRGHQTFLFDGQAVEPVVIGETFVEKVDLSRPISSAYRVEVTATRVRPEARSRDAARQRAAAEAAEEAKWLQSKQRWLATGRPLPHWDVRADASVPRPVVRIEPTFPKEALVLGFYGHVWARLTVRADGAVTEVEIVDQSPVTDRTYIGPTRKALKRWRFEPARDPSGRAIEAVVCQMVSYHVR